MKDTSCLRKKGLGLGEYSLLGKKVLDPLVELAPTSLRHRSLCYSLPHKFLLHKSQIVYLYLSSNRQIIKNHVDAIKARLVNYFLKVN